jgi:hypothetical protein
MTDEARRRQSFINARGEIDYAARAEAEGQAWRATFPARGEPAPHDTFGIEERCRREWEQSPALRAEFSCLEAYTAFRRAEAKGRVRIISRNRNA